jgi:polyisoprenoid-binding protein YceI
MRRLLFSLPLLAVAAAPAFAAQHWNVDYAKSRLGFAVSWGGEPFKAVFRSWKANIDFDPADLVHSHAEITVNVASEGSSDLVTDDGLKGNEGFQVSQFPTALFRTTGFTHRGGNNYVAAGTLSIKGVSRNITLPFTLTLTGNNAHVVGQAQVMRTDFNVGTGDWAKADPVAHEVTVNIDVTASKR